MPIISFTPADALQSAVVDAGIYQMQITKVDMKASSKETSINFWTTFRITEGPFAGKEFTLCFNTKTSSMSVLGNLQLMPHTTFLAIEAAINKTKVQPVARPDFDTDNLLNKPLDVQVAVDTSDGQLVNTLVAFMPAGSAKGPSW